MPSPPVAGCPTLAHDGSSHRAVDAVEGGPCTARRRGTRDRRV